EEKLVSNTLEKDGTPLNFDGRNYNVTAFKIKAQIKSPDDTHNFYLSVFDDVTDLVSSIKTDLAPEEVFVFTPKGDVINLPMGSNVIDFAYAIHSAVGNRMIGAKVDQKIVPLDYRVKTGEIIEIMTTKEVGRGPNRDWLSLVRTSEARNKIRAWFKKEKREENIVEGKAEIEREFKRNNIVMSDGLMKYILDSVGRRHSCTTADDFYAAVGYGGIQLWKLIPRVKEEYQKNLKPAEPVAITPQTQAQQNRKAVGGVLVDDMDNCLIKFSRCCNPLPGDDIIGFITRGFGVSIHKRGCTNVPKDMTKIPEPERWVGAHWAGEVKEEFKSTLHIVAANRSGLLADVTMQLMNMRISIHSLNAHEVKKSENAVISATISINGLTHLQQVIDRLMKVKGVISIDRS
ncbi:MAG: bifunctional (p)ppGpp synthetase/guanosine-3',5'-bis(diphosphate) 3'-pyrophosphohydrolase, partial [Clostridia bacterium]|nr:bifunctional (p)ppGpp synthetase/guanosine-3',5'-bis(diphosphate) 3'-pyrophosphohydrolase [Clostridia bacterium]